MAATCVSKIAALRHIHLLAQTRFALDPVRCPEWVVGHLSAAARGAKVLAWRPRIATGWGGGVATLFSVFARGFVSACACRGGLDSGPQSYANGVWVVAPAAGFRPRECRSRSQAGEMT